MANGAGLNSKAFSEQATNNNDENHRPVALHLKGIAIDAISIDPVDNAALPAHHILLGADILVIENLANLDSIENEEFHFICLPLKINGADGSPARAIAIEGFVP